MKMVFRFRFLIGVLLFVQGLYATASTNDCYDLGYEIENDEIIKVCPDRYFDTFEIKNTVSNHTHKEKVYDAENPTGKEKDLFPFEGVHVRKLLIKGQVNGRPLKLDSRSLTGILDLEEIEFENGIPEFEEETHWYKFGSDKNWRQSLKKIIVDIGDIQDLGRIRFIGDVKCLEIKGRADDKTLVKVDLSRCGALVKLIVPYELAKKMNINWAEALDRSSLNRTEVMSMPSSDGSNRLVLLHVAKNGEISNNITDIRIDALKFAKSPCIYLPFSFCRFWGDESQLGQFKTRFCLRKDSVRFYPAIDDPFVLNRMSRGSAFQGTGIRGRVTVSSAYSNLVFNVNGRLIAQAHQQGAAYELKFELDRGVENEITPYFMVDGCEVPLPVPLFGRRNNSMIRVTMPPARTWRIKAVVEFLLLLALLLGSVLMLAKRGMKLTTSNKWFLVVVLGLAICVMGCNGVLGDLMDQYIWHRVMSYLNASFVSSMVISVSTTLAEMVVGFLQGISVQPLGCGIDIKEMLTPVQDALGHITAVSWLSTIVLSLVRMLSEIVRDCADALWTVFGMGIVMWGLAGGASGLEESCGLICFYGFDLGCFGFAMRTVCLRVPFRTHVRSDRN